MSELDLTDPHIRAMAESNHQPEEAWTLDGHVISVHCQTCHHQWPCPTRRALDAIAADEPTP